jgi:hypothetical protein
MDDLNESQCEKLDQILSLFGDKDSLEADKVLTVESNERKANALIDMLVRRRFVSRVGEAIGRVLPLILNLNPNAELFIDNGGFLAEFKKQQIRYSVEPTVINIHTNGHGNTINTGNHASLTTQSTVTSKEGDPEPGPYLEADLRYNSSGRSNDGYSDKNPIEIDEQGNAAYVVGLGSKPVIHWRLDWQYTLFIHNNSSYPAFNIKIEQISEQKFSSLSKLPKINNLQPMANLELDAEFEEYMESTHVEADLKLRPRIPETLNGLCLQLTYLDEKRKPHVTLVTIEDQEIVSTKK